MSPNLGSVSVNPPGCVGNKLHAPGFADAAYYTTPVRPHSHKLNFAWQLRDVGPEDGGFGLVRGRRSPPPKTIDLAALSN